MASIQRFLRISLLLGLATGGLVAEERMTPELLWKLGRLGDTTVSADGQWVAYSVTQYKLEENAGTTSIYVRQIDADEERVLLRDWKTVSNVQFAKSPFGERIFFVGQREKSEDVFPQVWALNPVDGALLQVTEIEDGVANLKVSPTGAHLAFTRDVKLDQTVDEVYEDLPKAEARIIDSLMYRHWNAWHDYKYSHLHVAAIGPDGLAAEAKDLMPEMHVDCPVPPFGGSEQFAWAPDGKQIAYTAKITADWAESTNSDIYLLAAEQPGEAVNITEGRLGYDNDPVYSPDGKCLAFHSMERAGFEADRNRIMIYDRETGEITEATRGLDQMAHAAKWLPGGNELIFSSEYRGSNQLFTIGRTGEGLRQITKEAYDFAVQAILPDGERAIVSFMNMVRPTELAVLNLKDGSLRVLTHINDEIYKELVMPTVKERWVTATDGKKIHCWVIYPPDFDPSRKWPLLTYCQGGPQGQVGQWFSYRWNFHLMAANGYVVIAPNRRGLPGFGREWNDEISRDWGGQAMQDILSATDSMLAEPYIDKRRTAAIGASFGGYTVYWLMGNHEDRFHAMIAHCGVYNLESMYGSTEELFFVNWDLGGPYWDSPEIQKDYERFSPHRFAKNWKTPLMVIHGEKDFRVPVTQGMEAFTAAQTQGVPSRFLYFPEEGHWVMSPQNGVLWHRLFFDWLDRYCKEPPTAEGSSSAPAAAAR